MLYFNKLTGEHNAKKYFKKFLFWGNISLMRTRLIKNGVR